LKALLHPCRQPESRQIARHLHFQMCRIRHNVQNDSLRIHLAQSTLNATSFRPDFPQNSLHLCPSVSICVHLWLSRQRGGRRGRRPPHAGARMLPRNLPPRAAPGISWSSLLRRGRTGPDPGFRLLRSGAGRW
jgi:hypothetical protein